jgi:hypothetical protein
MANVIQIKRKTTTGIPALGQLAVGEGCINTVDNTLHYKKDAGTILTFKVPAEILASPELTGVPVAPTASGGTNTTQIATTAFVMAALAGAGAGDMLKSVYDTTDNGRVDTADNSLLLQGNNAAYFTGYTDTAIAALVASSPAALNTLNELALALGNDPNFASTITTLIGTKLDANSTIDGGTIA